MKSDVKIYENISCPLCGRKEIELIKKMENLDPGTMDIFPDVFLSICQECGMIHQNPCIPEKQMSELYSSLTDKNFVNHPNSTDDISFQENQRRLEFIKSYFSNDIKGKALLEIGSSNGSFLKLVKDKGFIVTGVEPSKENAEKIKKFFGIEVFNDLFENVNFEIRFDIICHFFVLEHTFEPLKFLQKARNSINSDGIMIFEVPSLESFIDLPFAINIFPYQHISHFYSETISLLLKKAYFDVVEIKHGKMFSSKPYGMIVVAKPVENDYFENLNNNYDIGKNLLRKYFIELEKNNLILSQRIESFINSYKKDITCVIFGAGVNGKFILPVIKKSKKVKKLFFTDNNPKLIGEEIDGIKVFSPKNLVDLGGDCFICASTDHQEDMMKELLNLGYDKNNILKAYDFKMFE